MVFGFHCWILGENSFSLVNSVDKMVLEVAIAVFACVVGQASTGFAEL